jgi:hypothetical protein
MEMVAHIRERGDVGAMIGDWVGERGSKRWIEGFGIAPISGISIKDIEYQAVLGRGWLSPWVDGGQFCGSRGMALPILGLRVRLRGEAAATHEVSYSATFIDGSEIGPVDAGEACEAESLAPVEAFQVVLRAKRAAAGPVAAEPEAEESEAEPPATAAAARPAAHKPAKVEPKGKAKAKLPPRGHAR